MTIRLSPQAQDDLDAIYDHIAKDSQERAARLIFQILSAIEAIAYMPYRFRRSIYYTQNHYRDLIVKGYTLPFRIDRDEIVVLAVIKWRLPK